MTKWTITTLETEGKLHSFRESQGDALLKYARCPP